MFKKWLSFALVWLSLTGVSPSLVAAQVKARNDAADAAAIKAVVATRGTGENKRVQVKRLDGTKLKGYVSQAGEEAFTLVDAKTGQPVSIAYGDVAQVKNRASRGDKIAVGIVAGAAAVAGSILVYYLARISNN